MIQSHYPNDLKGGGFRCTVRLLLAVHAALLLVGGVITYGQHEFDVLSYTFDIEITDDSDIISAEADVHIESRNDFLGLAHFDLVGPPGRPSSTGMKVTSIRRDGQNLPFQHDEDRLAVRLNTPLRIGARVTLEIAYAGIPADGLIISVNKFGERTFFADNWPDRARHWLPTVDRPNDKATVTFHITAPPHYEVVSNGPIVHSEKTTDGRVQSSFAQTKPLPTKLMVFGAADFIVQRDTLSCAIPVETWVYERQGPSAFSDFARAPAVVAFFDSLIGAFPYAKLANVQSRTRYGGMENAGAIFYNERVVGENVDLEGLVAHEIAHQWFGDAVTENDWPHVWLSEGFATYLTGLYFEHRYGPDRLRQYMRGARETVLAYHRTVRQRPLVDSGTDDPMSLLNANTYQKGAWILHMLRNEIGDKRFFEGLQAYYRKFKHANADTEDFFSTIEEVAGSELFSGYAQWLHRPGHPVVDVVWDYDERDEAVDLTVTQVQPEPSFQFVLDVALETTSDPSPIRPLHISEQQQTFRIHAPARPVELLLDPDVRLLFAGKVMRQH